MLDNSECMGTVNSQNCILSEQIKDELLYCCISWKWTVAKTSNVDGLVYKTWLKPVIVCLNRMIENCWYYCLRVTQTKHLYCLVQSKGSLTIHPDVIKCRNVMYWNLYHQYLIWWETNLVAYFIIGDNRILITEYQISQKCT